MKKLKVKLLSYEELSEPLYKRYTSSKLVPGYDDLTELWVLQNNVIGRFIFLINGKKYQITRYAYAGLITDKASTPGSSSDWYAAAPFYLWHDVDFSCHYLHRFSVEMDDGFRITNVIFRESIDWKIRDAHKNGIISGFRKVLWLIKKRGWYRAVNSIVGQGLYVNGDPKRGHHGKYSACTIERLF